MNTQNILITGGSGFIGTNAVEWFSSNKYNVLNIDIAPPKRKPHLQYWQAVDIRDKKQLTRAINDFAPVFVLHLAARTDLRGKTIDEYSSNTLGVKCVIEVLNDVPSIKRVVFTSSMYVCYPGYQPRNETDYSPHTLYGKSKVEGENIVRNIHHNYEWLIIRPTSIWGPWFGEPYDQFFKIVIGKKYFHLGNRISTKTYGYIDNSIFQIQQLLGADQNLVNGKTFFIGDYVPYNVQEWADEIAAECHYKIKTAPYVLFKIMAVFGDILKMMGIKFPMTSFRLHNMTTDNIQNLESTKLIIPDLPVQRIDGVSATIKWLNNTLK
jgi:nucleoside-diphosphate-sugar epimerase